MPGIASTPLAAAVAVLLLALACGQEPAGQKVSLDVKVTGAKMIPDHLTAHQNDEITLSITADRAKEIHLHGYDYKFQLKPGEKQTKTFKADKTGHFVLEIEDTGTGLGSLDIS